MPSLRSSIRRRLEEAEQEEAGNPVEEQDTVEQAANPVESPVEQAAAEAVAKKLDEQPSPVVEPRMEVEDDDDEFEDDVHELELKAAHAVAETKGHKFGSNEYADAVADRLRPQQEDRPRRERGPSMMAPVSRSTPSWSSGRTTPSKTELTGEEMAFCREQDLDVEEYRRNKAKMNQMKASGGNSVMNDDDQAYWVLGPGQIQLSPDAREWAKVHGMTETEMAKHLIEQDRLRRAGQIQADGEG